MDLISPLPASSASVFEASDHDPDIATAAAMADIDILLTRYRRYQDAADGLALLSEIEALRRFVLAQPSLKRALARPRRGDRRPMGQHIGDALKTMIGDVPKLVRSYSLQGARNLERDTRRAIASLMFIGKLDSNFI